MTIQKPISKAKQNKIDVANRFEQEQIIEENLFISTYTEKLFKLAFDFEENIQTNKWNAVKVSPEGFTFDLELFRSSDIFLPHSPIGDLRDIKDRFIMIRDEIDSVIESKRLEEEKHQKIQVAKDKIKQVLTEEERKLLGM
jgi:hypothetical protein